MINFLIGNEDMHVKNFSLMTRDGKVELTPAYDILNTTMVPASPKDDLHVQRPSKTSFSTSDSVKIPFC